MISNFLLGFLAFYFFGCSPNTESTLSDSELASTWGEMTLYLSKNTPQNSPTFASRAIGYIGLTMYESVVPGFPDYQSVASQLNGLSGLPTAAAEESYDWRISFNAGQAQILKSIYLQTSDENKAKIDSLERVFLNDIRKEVKDKRTVERSIAFGRAVADAIFEWSKNDGGHRAYLHNFDKAFTGPERPGSWKPPLYAQSFSHHPLHPYWGENRTFLAQDSSLELPKMYPYSTDPESDYYQQFKAVYEKDLSLTQKEKEIAIWWGDDPDETFTPPGHSFYLATMAIKHEQPPLIKCAEAYAKVGMSVADAFINCWKWKYYFFSERPNTFIPAHIDPEWVSFWPDPPFPAFPSGHAIQAAAMATALSDVFPEPFSFIDSAHVGRPRDELRDVDFVARPFDSFWDVALETANSRFYGGIHTEQDNQVGLEEGRRIAENVNALSWKKGS